jgi:GDP-L-fucose synthase
MQDEMRILITGSSGMIGQSLIKKYNKEGVAIDYFDKDEVNLLKWSDVKYIFELGFNPTHVIHLATWSGGIKWNMEYGPETFERTSRIALNVLKACEKYKIKKVVSIISSCAYPDLGNKPLVESDFWNGLPNETIRCHGLAKRNLYAYSLELRKRGIDAVCAVLQNCYGPGDRFNPERSKVVAALIKKFVEAKLNKSPMVTCFGSGMPLRELIYVDDAAYLIDLVLRKYSSDELINLTSSQEISIKDLTTLIANLVDYRGEIVWDTSKPDGQMRKSLDATKMKTTFGEQAFTSLETGLKRTIQWYLDNRDYDR